MRDYRYDHVHLRSPDPDATAPFHGPQRKRASHCSRDDGRRVASPGLGGDAPSTVFKYHLQIKERRGGPGREYTIGDGFREGR